MQPSMVQNEMLPLQQPILLAGGSLAPLNVFHDPVWMSGKPEDVQANQIQNLQRLSMLNKQLDEELNKYKPLLNNQVQGYNPNFNNFQSIFFQIYFKFKYFFIKKLSLFSCDYFKNLIRSNECFK